MAAPMWKDVFGPRLMIRLAAETMLLFGLLQPLGWLMSVRFQAESGFWPSWWMDCPACVLPELALPYQIPVIGGSSLFVLAGVGVATTLLLGVELFASRVLWSLTVTLAVLSAGHVVVGWLTRYPGSLPPLLIAIALPLAALTFSLIALDNWFAEGSDQEHQRGKWLGVACLVLGLGSMAALGAWATPVIVLAACAAVWSRVDTWNKRFVIVGAGLAVVSAIGKISVALRYPLYFWWL